jgi:hypothetical protein
MRGRRCAKWRPDNSPLDLPKGFPGGSTRFEGLLRGDEMPRCRALEIGALYPTDPDVTVANEPALHVQLANQITL